MSAPPVPPARIERRNTPPAIRWLLSRGLPVATLIVLVLGWFGVTASGKVPAAVLPGPGLVLQTWLEEVRAGRLLDDVAASLLRLVSGVGLAALVGVPLGMVLGRFALPRLAVMPVVDFLRCLSPLAWVPFAVLWFGVGDQSAIFIIFIATVCPLTVATVSAVTSIPSVYLRVAREYGLDGVSLYTRIIFPAIMPQLLTALRVTAGVGWVVIVAAEMIAGRDGLGFLVWDARNGLRSDLLICAMIMIGAIGLFLDRTLLRLSRHPFVRWGHGH